MLDARDRGAVAGGARAALALDERDLDTPGVLAARGEHGAVGHEAEALPAGGMLAALALSDRGRCRLRRDAGLQVSARRGDQKRRGGERGGHRGGHESAHAGTPTVPEGMSSQVRPSVHSLVVLATLGPLFAVVARGADVLLVLVVLGCRCPVGFGADEVAGGEAG